MPIVPSNPTGSRGQKDAKRHRDKQREVIKKKLPDIVSEENIITEKEGKKVKVPIKGIQIPDFRPGRRNKGEGEEAGNAGVGQGPGGPGDIIGRRPGDGSRPGSSGAGEEPGEGFIETEVDIEEIIEMIFEDLGLPNIREKEAKDLEVELGFEIRGIAKSGPWARLNKKATSKEAIKRFFAYLKTLTAETGRDELTCFDALREANGNLGAAFETLKDPEFKPTSEKVVPFPIFSNEDLRFHDIQESIQHQSNAVVFAMLDVSASMSSEKKYLARSMLFWIVEFLRKIYNNVEVKFVIYHSTAKFVDEETAFKTAESGGTIAHRAYELVNSIIQSKYPTNLWNVYVFHFSDGDDARPVEAVREARNLIEELKINMLSYTQIHVNGVSPIRKLLEEFESQMPIKEESGEEKMLISGESNYPFLGTIISEREEILSTIRELLQKERWEQ